MEREELKAKWKIYRDYPPYRGTEYQSCAPEQMSRAEAEKRLNEYPALLAHIEKLEAVERAGREFLAEGLGADALPGKKYWALNDALAALRKPEGGTP